MLSPRCAAQLNAICDDVCPLAKTHGPLTAAFDGSKQSAQPAWRCYVRSTLNGEGRYMSGTEYCTRHNLLAQALLACDVESESEATVRRVEIAASGQSQPAQSAALLDPWPDTTGEEVTLDAVDTTK